MIDEAAIQALMKRCQRGTTSCNEANSLHANCYGALGAMLNEIQFMRKKEFVCPKCGLRNTEDKEDAKFRVDSF